MRESLPGTRSEHFATLISLTVLCRAFDVSRSSVYDEGELRTVKAGTARCALEVRSGPCLPSAAKPMPTAHAARMTAGLSRRPVTRVVRVRRELDLRGKQIRKFMELKDGFTCELVSYAAEERMNANGDGAVEVRAPQRLAPGPWNLAWRLDSAVAERRLAVQP